jgi:hypothetical protein
MIAVFFAEEIFRIGGSQSWPREIDDVVFKDIDAKGPGSKNIRIDGWSTDKQVRNITLDNVRIDWKKVTKSSPQLPADEFVAGLAFR